MLEWSKVPDDPNAYEAPTAHGAVWVMRRDEQAHLWYASCWLTAERKVRVVLTKEGRPQPFVSLADCRSFLNHIEAHGGLTAFLEARGER